jgi:hypothetical protein
VRIRTIKPEFFHSETVHRLPLRARLTFIGLWCYCDDAGRAKDDARLVRAAVWPLDDEITVGDVAADLDALHAAGLVVRYEVDGRACLALPSFAEHQRINRPSPSKFPAPHEGSVRTHGGLTEDSVRAHGGLSEGSVRTHGGLSEGSLTEREREGEQGKGTGSREREGVAADAPTPLVVVAPSKPMAKPAPASGSRKYPHFPDALRVYLHGAWEAFVGPLDLGRFVKTLGPAFADRPPASPDRLYCAVAAFGQERDECDARERGFRTLERFVADLPAYLRAGDRVARSPDWALPADVVAAWAPYAVRELAGAA